MKFYITSNLKRGQIITLFSLAGHFQIQFLSDLFESMKSMILKILFVLIDVLIIEGKSWKTISNNYCYIFVTIKLRSL